MRSEVTGPSTRFLLQVWAVVCVTYGAWIVLAGPRYGADSHTYSRWADVLIAMRFNVAAYLREQTFITPPVFYILWTLTVALLKSVFGASWAAGVLALNWVSIGWAAFVTLDRIRGITGSAAAMLLAMLLLLTAADLLIFAPFVLSDMIFWALSTAVIGAALRLTADADGTPQLRTIVTGSVLTVAALLFRPVGIPLALIWLLAVLAGRARMLDRFGPLLLAASVVGAIAAMFVHAYLLMHPDRWPFGPTPAFLALLSDEYHGGILVYAPESSLIVSAATSVPGAVRLTLQKLFYFLTPWLPHYSASHTLLNLLFFVPAYGLSAIALARRARLAPAQQRATVLLVTYILALSVFHAMMQIEFDHRYRLPMLPVLIVLSAIGLEAARRPRTLASIRRTK